MDDRFFVEQLIAGSFVKYTVLGDLISQSYAGSTCTNINLFIDLNSVLKPMYSVSKWTYKSSSRYEIAATVLNMCGHYREFFRYLGVATNIYIIYGLNCPSVNNTYVAGYNNKFTTAYMMKQEVTELIEENLKVLNLICQYLPHIYFFDIGDCEVSSMIDYLIKTTKAREMGLENIVITRDVLALQLVPEHDVRIIRPTKTKDGDESYIVWNYNLWDSFVTKYRKGKTPVVQISNSFFQNVLAMTGVIERNMYSIFSIPKAFQIIDVGVRNGLLDPMKFYSQSSINTVLAALDIPCNPTELEMRFRAINTHYQSTYILPMEKPEFKRLRLIDLEDVQSLKEIISKYFIATPIDLDKL